MKIQERKKIKKEPNSKKNETDEVLTLSSH